MIQKKRAIVFGLFLGVLLILPGVAAQAQNPTLLKRTISVTARRWSRYWKNPKAAEPQYNTWCWTPQVKFQILGPVTDGSQFQVEIALPDGRPWMTLDMRTRELQDDYLDEIKMVDVDDDTMERRAILTPAGLFPFKIILKNELQGTNNVMFAGKFKVGTYTPNQAIPEFKGKQEFYVDHDWMLPVGYIWLDPQIDENVPALSALMTFRGQDELSEMTGYLYYNGKKIAEARGNDKDERSNSTGEKNSVYYNWQFTFATVRGFNKDTSANNYSSIFLLDKNPGAYEIKVLTKGELTRTLAFSVGTDGKITDNGIAKNNKIGGVRFIVPVKIIAEAAPNWDKTAWQNGAFYGNPLAGFTALP